MSAVNIKFNNYSLQDTSVDSAQRLTTNIIYNQLPDKVINLKHDSIRDSFRVVDVQYTQKIIAIDGWLISDTGDHLKDLIDTFKKNLRGNEGNLDIETYGGSGIYRRWISTVQSILVPEEHWQINQKPFSCEFLCSPYATATSSESESYNNITTTPYEDTITITKGSYRPKAKISFHVDNTTLTLIRFENDTTSDWIQVETSFSAGDDLVIDCDAETVELNDVAQDFSGVFPMLEMGANDFKVIQTGTKGIDLTIEWWPRFL